jgi:nitrogen fixation protein NifU and related proteins
MSDLRELYQEVILDHSKRPRNFREMPDATHEADGHNRLCGDKLHVYLRVSNGRIADASFKGSGCAISTASASMMTDELRGKTVEEAMAVFKLFHEAVTSASTAEPPHVDELGKLGVFSGVREFPVRVKCATLPWHTMQVAVEKRDEPASTE